MKILATNICKNYLSGVWGQVNINNIVFESIPGGLSNILYYVSLPESLRRARRAEPAEVLFRIYGQTHGNNIFEPLLIESVVFALLSERGVGPKLYAVFPGGRIEQYIHSKSMKTKDMSEVRISRKIAHTMATMHAMDVPIEKTPSWIWKTMNRWLETLSPEIKPTGEGKKIDLRKEYFWLKEKVKEEDVPVVFCHNDINVGNVLLKSYSRYNPIDPRIAFIDLEYCSYNYRAFDIANHFLEWTFDYTNEKYPFFSAIDNYPDDNQKTIFVKEYLKKMGSLENHEKLLKEVELFTLVSHYFWALWSFVNAERRNIVFGYSEYGNQRISSYIHQKRELTSKKIDDESNNQHEKEEI